MSEAPLAVDPPPRRRKLWRRMFLALAAVVCLVLVLHAFVLPIAFEYFVRKALVDAGIKNPRFHTRWVTLWRAVVSDVAGGDVDPILIDSVVISYTPRSLWHGQVYKIRMRGVKLTISRRNNRLEAGPIRNIIAEAAQRPATVTGTGLPFWSLELIDSKIVVSGESSESIPFDVILWPNNNRRLEVWAVAGKQQNLMLSGEFDPKTWDGNLYLRGREFEPRLIAAMTRVTAAPVTGGGACAVEASLYLQAGQGTLGASIKPRDVWIGESIHNIDVRGMSADISLTADVDGTRLSNLQSNLSDGRFTASAGSVSAQGISGRFSLADPLAPGPQQSQQLSVAKLEAGGTALESGTITFNLHGWDALHLANMRWNCLGGVVQVSDTDVQLRPPKCSATVVLEHVDLQKLLEQFASNKATGQGSVSGRLPVFVDGSGIRLGDGELEADGPGRLRVSDTDAVVQALPEQSVPEQTKQGVVEALKDFEYNVLRAQLRGGTGGIALFVRIAGRGHSGRRQPLDIELRVRGLDQALSAYLGIRGKLSPGE